ncbi:RHS repeat domain-containing protein [Xanthomonas axonopodis]|nr:RHS repeat domain-containing protein [Xanthomonas axonopodis]
MRKVVSFVYDELGRATTTTYQDGNTITATYDAGNRLRKLVDTAAAGALSWDYDDMTQSLLRPPLKAMSLTCTPL